MLRCEVNRHHVQWESSDINEGSESILDYLHIPSFLNRIREEVKDLTLVTNAKGIGVGNCRVFPSRITGGNSSISTAKNKKKFNLEI